LALTEIGTFRDYINDELLARQPARKLRAREGKRLVAKNLELFLILRSRSLNEAPEFLPTFINAIVKGFLDHGDNTEDSQESITRLVIQIIIKRCADPIKLVFAPTVSQRRILEHGKLEYAMLAMSLYATNDDLAETLLKNGTDPWVQSSLFQPAIQIAVEMDNKRIVLKILSMTDQFKFGDNTKKHVNLQSRVTHKAINTTVRKNSWDMAELLMRWSSSAFAKPSLDTICSWIFRAVESGSLTALKTLQNNGYFQLDIVHYEHFIVKGLIENPDPEPVLRFCIQQDLLEVHCPYDTPGLLSRAVYEGSVRLAKAFFAVNAYDDFPEALRAAIRYNDEPMVRVLLENGVDPEARVHPPPSVTTCELASANPAIYDMLKDAIQKKMLALGDNYRAPHQSIASHAKRGMINVAYTFHAPKSKDEV
jgi:hypothetical protein